jgi:hypothetical protein
MKILFLHGWQSVPGGVKPTYLVNHGHEVIHPALPDEDFDAAIQVARAEFDRHQPDAVVGSSRGGAVAMNINSGQSRLVLLRPAWKRWGTASTVKDATVILHSRADDVIPFAESEELVRNSGLPWYTLIEVGNDHRLADPESLETILEACVVDDADEDQPAEPLEEDVDALLLRDWTGLCYTAAMRWITVSKEPGWVVVHGTILSVEDDKRIAHAWCERGEVVVDLARPIAARIIERERYYRLAQPKDRKLYSAEDALVLSVRNRLPGPWDESEPTNR